MSIIYVVEFAEWIEAKFLEWRKDRYGRGTSVAEFAKQFGVSQQLMSDWMKKGGKKPRTAKYINALAAIYGNEVYAVLGLTPPGKDDYSNLPPDVRLAVEEVNRELAARGIGAESPEAEKITIAIFAKYGWSHTSSSDVEDDDPPDR